MAVFATLDPANKASQITLSNGNLTATGSTNFSAVRSTIGVTSGKWYWEIHIDAGTSSDNNNVGICNSSYSISTNNQLLGLDVNSWAYLSDGTKYSNNVNPAYGASFITGDIVSVALDMDGGTITFYKNNSSQGQAFSGLSGTIYAANCLQTNSQTCTANFGASAFTYSPPGGYNAGLYTGTITTASSFSRALLGVGK